MPALADSPQAKYISQLHAIHHDLTSGLPKRVSDARRKLAKLRQGLIEGRQEQAYDVVFSTSMPNVPADQDTWVLVGGLFAIHPKVWTRRSSPRTIGASMGELARRAANADTVSRRFTQLLGRDRQSLPHHLRQAVTLLATRDTPIHYGQLLDNLTVLLGHDPRGERASQVRLTWAREYHMKPSTTDIALDAPETTP
jgi:CRISPR system Cascade subunit CasB